MVSNDNEYSVLKPYFLFCIINELANRIIRIFNSGFPRVRITIHFYVPSRVGVGTMVFPINYLITVMAEEGALIVKIAVSTIDELRFLA